MMKTERVRLVLLLLLALLLSTYLFFRTYVISLDGALQYIPMAKDFATGSFKKALSQGQQPLYSLILAIVYQAVPDWETAGKLVSSLFGIAMILPVYFLGKGIFGKETALLSTLLLVIHPYVRRFSADVLKESTYLFFLATALWFSWRTLQGEKRYPFLFVPLFAATAYLTRPDGVEVLLIVFFYVLFIKRFSPPGKKGSILLLLLVSSIVLFLPYLLHLRGAAGEWTLSRVKGIGEMLGWETFNEGVPLIHKIPYSFKKLNLEIFALYHPLYVFLGVIGLWKKASSGLRAGQGFLIACWGLHYAVLFLLIFNLTYWKEDKTIQAAFFSGRHVLPLLLFSIYWAGEGFWTICQGVQKKFRSLGTRYRAFGHGESKLVPVIILILVLAIVLPKTLKPQRYERLSEKWVGTWIKNQSRTKAPIFTMIPRVAYYAETPFVHIDLGKDSIEKIEASMAEKGADYLVLQEKKVAHLPEAMESIRNKFIEVVHYKKKGMEEIIVYEKVQ